MQLTNNLFKLLEKMSYKRRFLMVSSVFLSLLLVSFLIYFVAAKNSSISYLKLIAENKTKRTPGIYQENFSDSASVGTLSDSAGIFTFRYTKSKIYSNPFVGAYFPLEDLKLDLADYNEIEIQLEVSKARRIPVQLSMHYQNNLVRYLTNYIELEKGIQQYVLNVNEFSTPAEWFQNNHLSLRDLPTPSLKNIKTISLEGCHLLSPGETDVIKIHQIKFTKDLSTLKRTLIVINLFTSVLLLFLLKIAKPREKLVLIPINPKDMPEQKDEFSSIALFISKNYVNADLTANNLQKELGMNKSDISRLIKQNTELSFPQYLSKVRIEEAKRLLREGNIKSIKEIAFEVGFNSPNNFNRVFKSVEGVTPLEFLVVN